MTITIINDTTVLIVSSNSKWLSKQIQLYKNTQCRKLYDCVLYCFYLSGKSSATVVCLTPISCFGLSLNIMNALLWEQ